MREIILITAAPLLLVTGIALSTPAPAMEIGPAVKACQANPNCAILPTEGPGVQMIIKSGTGKGDSGAVIDCPPKGQCVTVKKQPKGAKTQTGARPTEASSGKPAKGGSTPLAGGLLDTSQGFNAQGPGATGAPQVGGRGAAPAGQIR
jgi:hypothetical protein